MRLQYTLKVIYCFVLVLLLLVRVNLFVFLVINPGDLAEPEDLQELLKAVEKAEKIPLKSERLQGALRYAEMVIDYVNGGSGTKDFIERALSSLTQALES